MQAIAIQVPFGHANLCDFIAKVGTDTVDVAKGTVGNRKNHECWCQQHMGPLAAVVKESKNV